LVKRLPSLRKCFAKQPLEGFMNTHNEEQQDMYGMAEIPHLIPTTGALQPGLLVPYNDVQAGRSRADLMAAQRRIQRPPKLGEIGRSARVVIEDEDLDDIINNNRSFPVSQRVSAVA
ncbi:hypothetical protein DNTS_011396, partial [Danionella cerebrum]